jgi:hypothetical protein
VKKCRSSANVRIVSTASQVVQRRSHPVTPPNG